MDKLQAAELFLLDMDGTLYLGDDVFEGAVDFIHTLEKLGKKYIYLTNNSSRAGVDYISSGALTHSAPILDLSLKNLHAI